MIWSVNLLSSIYEHETIQWCDFHHCYHNSSLPEATKKKSQNSEIQVVGFMTRVRKETYHVREPLSETLSNPNDNFMSTHVLLAPGHGRSNKKG